MSNPAPGWYPAPHANNEQRYWDGARWIEPGAAQAPSLTDENAGGPAGSPVKKSAGLAIASLVVGIGAFLTGILPVIGALIGAAAVVLGVIALVKKQPKGFAITGLVLGAVALISSIAVTAGITANLPSTSSKPTAVQIPTATPTPSSTPSEEPSEEPSDEPAPPATDAAPDPNTFYPTDDRSLALVVKDPDSFAGANIILYGSIMQFDSATGRCTMLIDTAATQQEYSYDYDQSVMAIAGDADMTCPVFDPLVEDDHVKIWATIMQSFSYDTQIGGNTTVPLVKVWYAEMLPATEY